MAAANKPSFSATDDWVRALTRTARITPASTRTLWSVVAEHAVADPDRPALIGEDQTFSYGDLAARADHVARWAAGQNLRPGDVVALLLDNAPDYVAVWLGLSRLGIVTALVNTQLAAPGIAHSLTLAGAAHLLCGARFTALVADAGYEGRVWPVDGDLAGLPAADLAEAPPVRLQDSALLIYTSGTTGLPKAARVSHYRVMMWAEWFAGLTNAGPADRLYNCLPMYHSVGGVVAVGAMLAAGGAVIVRRGFSASRFWDDLVASEATIFQYIGELCRYLLAAPSDGSDHKLRLCVGNGLRADVWEAFAARFAIPRIIEFYAATEGSFSLFNVEGRPGAIGRIPRFIAHRSPVAIVRFDDGAQMPLRDAGGRCMRCPPGEAGEAIGMIAADAGAQTNRFEGYTNDNESERKILRDVFAPGDMWFRTGDLMRQDKDGFFYFVDRVGDTFRWKGENVATTEVADVLAGAPGVLDVAVYGVAVPHCEGRAGMAALVTDASFDFAAFQSWVARLPRYARPLFLRLCDDLDRTGTFKLKKADLAKAGFDPSATGDTLYLATADGFARLDTPTFARIVAGEMRL